MMFCRSNQNILLLDIDLAGFIDLIVQPKDPKEHGRQKSDNDKACRWEGQVPEYTTARQQFCIWH